MLIQDPPNVAEPDDLPDDRLESSAGTGLPAPKVGPQVLRNYPPRKAEATLQFVLSLLRLRLNHIPGGDTADTLRAAVSQIETVIRLHGCVDDSRLGSVLPVGELLTDVAERRIAHAGVGVLLALDVTDVEVAPVALLPLLLAADELIGNAIRHAFPLTRAGTVWVSLVPNSSGGFVMSVSDDGVGMPQGRDLVHGGGLGGVLLDAFARQLGGRIEVQSDRGLTTVRVIVERTAP